MSIFFSEVRRGDGAWPGAVRIWPFGDLFGIFPYDVILTEDEHGAVNGEAVLFDRDGVVNGHGPGSLGHRLLVHSLAPRRPRLPAGPSGRARETAASIAAGQFVFKSSHSWVARILLEKPKLTPEKKWKRSITTRTAVPSSGSVRGVYRPRTGESHIHGKTHGESLFHARQSLLPWTPLPPMLSNETVTQSLD